MGEEKGGIYKEGTREREREREGTCNDGDEVGAWEVGTNAWAVTDFIYFHNKFLPDLDCKIGIIHFPL